MRLVYCISGTYNSGGMERVLAKKANYLISMGFEVLIITTDQKNRPSYFSMDEKIQMLDLGINYCDSVNFSLFKKVLAYKTKQKKHKIALTKALHSYRADIVISMFDHEVDFLYQITDPSKKILEIHFSRFKRLQYGRTGLMRLIDQYRSNKDLQLVQKYDRFVVLTKEDQGYWGSLANIRVIPNPNSFTNKIKAVLNSQQAIAVGRFDHQKGFEDLIEIWSKVYSEAPNWILKIYGHGELEEKFKLMIEERGMKDHLFLCSPTKQIKEAYLESSMLLMTSRYEGLPMTLLEAQVCGLPLIAYTCKCGPRDIISDGINGFLVQEGDQEEMVQRILELIRNKNLREQMGAESFQNSKNYEVEKVMNQWLNLFKEIQE